MKNTTIALLTAFAFSAAAQAGEDHSAKGGKEVVPPPPSCLWTWFAGGSVGEVTNDWDEEIYSLHIGVERKCPGGNCSHAIYLEVGYTDKKDAFRREDGSPEVAQALGLELGENLRVGVEAEIMPITINYKYECGLTNKLNWYVGAGAGIALVDLEFSTGVDSVSFDDNTFYAHAFAGVVYNFSESFEAFLGARYVWMDDPDLTGFAPFDNLVSLDGEVIYELGARINF